MYPYDENNNSTNPPETGSERPAEDGSYRIVKPDAEREACYRDASYTPRARPLSTDTTSPAGAAPNRPSRKRSPTSAA